MFWILKTAAIVGSSLTEDLVLGTLRESSQMNDYQVASYVGRNQCSDSLDFSALVHYLHSSLMCTIFSTVRSENW